MAPLVAQIHAYRQTVQIGAKLSRMLFSFSCAACCIYPPHHTLTCHRAAPNMAPLKFFPRP